MYKLQLSKYYLEELKSAVYYIRHDLQNRIAANNLKEEVKKTYKKIKENPFLYPAVPDEYLASVGFRFVMVKNYMLFYIVIEKEIIILRFLYGHRDWINILGSAND
jgi:plasmid stabilization system protein ParE